MNIDAVIQEAKLGRTRRDAQEDTCAVFAAALYDVLSAEGISCQMVTAEKKGFGAWTHAVVEVASQYYDSMGEFSTDIYRKRARTHPNVLLDIAFQADSREDSYEEDLDEMHAFYVKTLNKALRSQTSATVT